jgi:hypothetical protein
MIAAFFLLLQIFTEPITPQSDGRCIAVLYRGVTYKAQKATRYRVTGRITLLMRDRYPSTLSAFSPSCGEQCEAKVQAAQAECEEQCRSGNLLQEALCRSKKCSSPKPPPPNCVPDCEEKEKAEIEAEAKRRFSERPKPIPGRQIELSGYDSIANDSSCSCAFGAKCVNE